MNFKIMHSRSIINKYKQDTQFYREQWKDLNNKEQIIEYERFNRILWSIYWDYKFSMLELIHDIKISQTIRSQYTRYNQKLSIYDIGCIISDSLF